MAARADRGWILYTCCLVLGFLLSCATASRFPTALAPAFQRSSAAQVYATQNFRAELLHRDHPDSPLRPPTGTDRFAAATARSKTRAAARRLAGSEIADATPVTPGSYEYLMTIHLGTPPQKFVMIVDSGSDLVWVQCLPCNAPQVCFPTPNPSFDPSASSSYAAVPCNSSQCDPLQFAGIPSCDSSGSCYISYEYVDGSGIAGELSTETIAVSNSITGVPWELENFLFGCMNNDTVSFAPPGSAGVVDGLAGFGRGPNSLPSQLTQSTVGNVFSYCLIPFTAATVLTSSMLFGLPGFLPMAYTPVLTYDETSYWVNMTGISVNGSDLGIPSSAFQFNTTTRARGTIIDSGTTRLVLMPNILTPVVKAFQGLINYPEVKDTDFPLCYNLTGVTHPRLPSMSLYFAEANGTMAEFPLTYENLFIPPSDDHPEIECLAMESTGDDDSGNMLVGNIAQANHYIEYDVTNLQIGWTPSFDCASIKL